MISAALIEMSPEYIQGTQEWLALRKTKITATDACIIMGASPWKTKTQLYKEKTCDINSQVTNQAMQRGIDLEPIARDLFNLKTGWNMQPTVMIKDWAMASLDGRDESSGSILEIKCPGAKDHAIALSGKVPDHYYPQIQHQMYVANVCMAYYFSFDGTDGVIVKVKRDDEYIEKMVKEEFKFFACLRDGTPPEADEDEYIFNDSPEWLECAFEWRNISGAIKMLEKKQEELREKFITIGRGLNTKGAGISMCQVTKKGNVDYSKIPELKNIDLDKYRKAPTSCWRIVSQ